MPFEELWVNRIFTWCDKCRILDRLEVFSIVFFADVCFETDGKDNMLVISEADESFVKGLIVE